jgi:hypothetical protein
VKAEAHPHALHGALRALPCGATQALKREFDNPIWQRGRAAKIDLKTTHGQ